jgi:hypothetical protein
VEAYTTYFTTELFFLSKVEMVRKGEEREDPEREKPEKVTKTPGRGISPGIHFPLDLRLGRC